MQPFIITIKTAAVATFITFFIGIGLAYLVCNLKRGKFILDAVIMLPMVLPPTVVGFFLLIFLGKRSPIGQFFLKFDISFVFTWKAAVIAAVIVSLPLMYRTTRAAFELIDPNIINAAKTLGISNFRIFRHIIIPNSKSGIIAGVVLSFTRALGEFGATIMFAGNVPNQTQTLSTAIYAAVQANDYDLATKWAILLATMSLIFIFAVNRNVGK